MEFVLVQFILNMSLWQAMCEGGGGYGYVRPSFLVGKQCWPMENLDPTCCYLH